METGFDRTELDNTLNRIDQEIRRLNDDKIVALVNVLKASFEIAVPSDYLKWEVILIIVPNRKILEALKQYKYRIPRIAVTLNPYANDISVVDQRDWKNASRTRTKLEFKHYLRTNFGGEAKQNRQ